MQKILFVCSQNKLRSPTAEQVFSEIPGLDVLSAGTNHDAVTPLSSELVEWADKIFVMENMHREKLQKRFRSSLKGKKIICLGIPDNFSYMDPELVAILKKKLPQFL
ncbi:MAG TPA: low molecular weight protein tyrosine phosphatase family protein [Arenimonas sp.]|nr:low molecular weight protein tyrosine phosphatase family protein [Arenimonas sp.]HOZ04732.1 low molecular weight protein tyrosine phosphatase family protein [Arenimonas sp.]HPO24682.1 low molecular weight protein tyrosine phosphatase family protein [Arenimonas sp.]HPW32152.1 low molecular weight protein tyrosine phosphatase family protein [Arenimonas sp.]